MTATAKTHQFYYWFKNFGGDLARLDQEKVNNSILHVPLQYSGTLKLDPQKTKETHNYKFKQRYF